ncbi:riboflavin synthase subunit alpha [Corynebacterium sp. NML140438]|uniref:riboflavin synthase n=1 Tax=Corynebacterium sp. NML140438 TaxID=1906334 RepID=UPI00091C17B3|nr:riboflavin synthase [Corynebacterium sp. NML140438]OIR42384.1 riboflavin synthase subunit alpha [Corynebacterium sp. NML140438]
MFTGLVEEVGSVVSIEPLDDAVRICIGAEAVLADVNLGDSIAVDGVCLTVVEATETAFTADVMLETLRRSRIGEYEEGTRVNLERALAAGDKLGGHIVQGHVDAVVTLQHRSPAEHWDLLRFSLPDSMRRYVVEKGSIAISGISLTVSAVGEDWFEVSLIPATLEATTAGAWKPGDMVNIEVDIIAKYVENMVRH